MGADIAERVELLAVRSGFPKYTRVEASPGRRMGETEESLANVERIVGCFYWDDQQKHKFPRAQILDIHRPTSIISASLSIMLSVPSTIAHRLSIYRIVFSPERLLSERVATKKTDVFWGCLTPTRRQDIARFAGLAQKPRIAAVQHA
jgi:hypothetical protein